LIVVLAGEGAERDTAGALFAFTRLPAQVFRTQVAIGQVEVELIADAIGDTRDALVGEPDLRLLGLHVLERQRAADRLQPSRRVEIHPGGADAAADERIEPALREDIEERVGHAGPGVFIPLRRRAMAGRRIEIAPARRASDRTAADVALDDRAEVARPIAGFKFEPEVRRNLVADAREAGEVPVRVVAQVRRRVPELDVLRRRRRRLSDVPAEVDGAVPAAVSRIGDGAGAGKQAG
jgi:hypothetical protein